MAITPASSPPAPTSGSIDLQPWSPIRTYQNPGNVAPHIFLCDRGTRGPHTHSIILPRHASNCLQACRPGFRRSTAPAVCRPPRNGRRRSPPSGASHLRLFLLCSVGRRGGGGGGRVGVGHGHEGVEKVCSGVRCGGGGGGADGWRRVRGAAAGHAREVAKAFAGSVRPPKRGLDALAVHVEEFATTRTLLQRPQAFVALSTHVADEVLVVFAVFAAAAALAILAIAGLAALALAAGRLAALALLCWLQRSLAR